MQKANLRSSSVLLLIFFQILIGNSIIASIYHTDFNSYFNQTRPGILKGQVIDSSNSESLPFALIMVKQGKKIIKTIHSDMDGYYTVSPLAPGKYDVYCQYIGYADSLIKGVEIHSHKTSVLNFQMTISHNVLQEVHVVWEAPLIDGNKTAKIVSEEDVMHMAVDDITSVAAQTAGVFNENSEVRGTRANTTTYFIDGIKVNDPYRASVGNEEYNSPKENVFQSALSSPFSTFAIDVDGAAYSNSRRFLSRGQLPPKDAIRIEEFINYFEYNYPDPKDKHPFSIYTEIADCPWNESSKLLHIGIQGKHLEKKSLPPSNLVFLIDVSGSMSSAEKLPLLKASFRLLVHNLSEDDRIAIIVYAGAAGLVLPPTSCDRKNEILTALESLKSGGSTAVGAGIKLAYQIAEENLIIGGNNRIILATDGDFNVGISNENDLISLIEEKRESGVFLSVLGFGTGNYKDARMEQLANHGNGNFNYIDSMLEANKVLVNEMAGTLITIAKDVKIQMEFNPAVVKEYRLVGFENRMLQKKDFEDDRKDAGELGAGHSVTALYEIVLQSSEETSESNSRYQSTILNSKALKAEEMGMVHFRYKKHDGKKSILIDRAIPNGCGNIESASEDFRFSASVAAFGLLMKDSEFKGKADYENLIALAKSARGEDEYGYRAEFIRLAEVAKGLQAVAYSE